MWYVSQKENMIPKSHGDRLQSIDLEMKMREREREREIPNLMETYYNRPAKMILYI